MARDGGARRPPRAGSRWMRTASSSSSTRPRCGISSTRRPGAGLLPRGRRPDPDASRGRSASMSSTTRCARATKPSARRRLLREPVLSAHNDYTDWSGPNRVRELLPDESEDLLEEALRHHPGLARDQPADPVQPARHRRREERRARRPADRRAPLPAPRRADLPAEVQPARTAGSTSRRCAATRRWCSRCTTRRRTAARASRRTLRSRIPTTPPGAPPRQSIEARALVFF